MLRFVFVHDARFVDALTVCVDYNSFSNLDIFSSDPESLTGTIIKCIRKCQFSFTFVINKQIIWFRSYEGFKYYNTASQ